MFEKPPAAPPPRRLAAPTGCRRTLRGVTMSVLPSPVMSPSAGVVMISAPGMPGLLSFFGKPVSGVPLPSQA